MSLLLLFAPNDIKTHEQLDPKDEARLSLSRAKQITDTPEESGGGEALLIEDALAEGASEKPKGADLFADNEDEVLQAEMEGDSQADIDEELFGPAEPASPGPVPQSDPPRVYLPKPPSIVAVSPPQVQPLVVVEETPPPNLWGHDPAAEYIDMGFDFGTFCDLPPPTQTAPVAPTPQDTPFDFDIFNWLNVNYPLPPNGEIQPSGFDGTSQILGAKTTTPSPSHTTSKPATTTPSNIVAKSHPSPTKPLSQSLNSVDTGSKENIPPSGNNGVALTRKHLLSDEEQEAIESRKAKRRLAMLELSQLSSNIPPIPPSVTLRRPLPLPLPLHPPSKSPVDLPAQTLVSPEQTLLSSAPDSRQLLPPRLKKPTINGSAHTLVAAKQPVPPSPTAPPDATTTPAPSESVPAAKQPVPPSHAAPSDATTTPTPSESVPVASKVLDIPKWAKNCHRQLAKVLAREGSSILNKKLVELYPAFEQLFGNNVSIGLHV